MKTSCSCVIPIRIYGNENYNKCTRCNKIIKNKIMKPSKMLELVENLEIGEKVIIEKYEDHLFIDKKSLQTEWTPAPSDNINIHGVDLSILNEEDWFYVEIKGDPWIAKRNITEVNSSSSVHYSIDGEDMYTKGYLCLEDDINLLRKATPDDLAPLFEKYPQYSPVKVGDIGLFYDDIYSEANKGADSGDLFIGRVKAISEYGYKFEIENWGSYKHFFKVSENETIAEIKERFLKESQA